jgi:hypothetical protein
MLFPTELSRKSVATRGLQQSLAGPVKFVGNAVQSAYHGPVSIKETDAVNTQRAHQSHWNAFCIGTIGFPANFQGSALYLSPFFTIEVIEAFKNIQVFQKGIMIETGEAAIVLAPRTVETIIIRRRLVFSIHGCIDYF